MKEVERLLEKAQSNRATINTLPGKGERDRLRHRSILFRIALILATMGGTIVITGCEAPQQQAQRQEGVKKEVAKIVVAYPDLITGTPYQASGAVPLAKTYNGVPTETLVKDGFFRVLNAARLGADNVWYEVMVSNGSTDYHMWINASDLNGMTVTSYKSEEQQWQKQKSEQERAWKQYADQQQQQEKAAIREADRQRDAELNRQRMEYQAQREAQIAEAQNFQAMQNWQAQQGMQQQIADLNGRMESSQIDQQRAETERGRAAQREAVQQRSEQRAKEYEQQRINNVIQQIHSYEDRMRFDQKRGENTEATQRRIDQLKRSNNLP